MPLHHKVSQAQIESDKKKLLQSLLTTEPASNRTPEAIEALHDRFKGRETILSDITAPDL